MSKPAVGVTVPTGYSFNLDGTAIYLTMASLFVANAMGMPMDLGAQISLLIFMIIASKGAAGDSGGVRATGRNCSEGASPDSRHRPVSVKPARVRPPATPHHWC